MKVSQALSAISRRDLFRVAGRYGLTSTLFAAGGLGGAMTLGGLAQARRVDVREAVLEKAKHNLKFGASGFNQRNLLIERMGALFFAQDLEERTDGESALSSLVTTRSAGSCHA